MDKHQTNCTTPSSNEPGKRKAQIAQLLAAVSVLSVSLGLAPAQADQCAPGQHCDGATSGSSQNGQYLRKKLPGKMKSGTLTMTRGAIGPGSGQTDTNSGGGATNTEQTPSTPPK
jgi:hypothetical protein